MHTWRGKDVNMRANLPENRMLIYQIYIYIDRINVFVFKCVSRTCGSSALSWRLVQTLNLLWLIHRINFEKVAIKSRISVSLACHSTEQSDAYVPVLAPAVTSTALFTARRGYLQSNLRTQQLAVTRASCMKMTTGRFGLRDRA